MQIQERLVRLVARITGQDDDEVLVDSRPDNRGGVFVSFGLMPQMFGTHAAALQEPLRQFARHVGVDHCLRVTTEVVRLDEEDDDDETYWLCDGF